MSTKKRAAYTAQWQRTFREEIDRRKSMLEVKPAQAVELFSQNPRGLIEDCGQEHIWIPATTTWIHDGKGKGHKIDGVKRRGLVEAMPYKDKEQGVIIVPQVCNECCAMRERETRVRSEAERKADHKKTRRSIRLASKTITPDEDTFTSLDSFGL